MSAGVAAALALGGCTPPSGPTQLANAKTSMAQRDYATATVQLKSYLQGKPDDGVARMLLGRALLEQGDSRAADVELSKAQQVGVDPEQLTPLLARAWLSSGKARNVIQSYATTVLADKSAQADLRATVGGAYLRMGKVKEGQAALQDALAIDKGHPGALLFQAKVAAAGQHFDEALALAGQSVRDELASGEAHRFRADLLLGVKGDLEGARKELQLAKKDPLHEAAAGATLVGILAEHQRFPEARTELDALKKKFGARPGVQYADAYLTFRAGDLGAAKLAADELMRKFAAEPRVLQLSAAVDLKRGDLASAASKLSKAIGAAAGVSAGARIQLADVYLAMGDAERVLVALRPLLDARLLHPDVLTRAGQAYLMSGNLAAAESAYVQAAKARPEDPRINTSLALFELARGQAERGFLELNEIAAKDSGITADMALVSAHLRRGEYDAALGAIAKLDAKQPGKPLTEQLRAQALRAQGERTAARAAYAKALSVEPAYVAASIALVTMDMEERRFDAAGQRLDALLKARPDTLAASLLRLRLLVLQGASNDQMRQALTDAVNANRGEVAPRVAQIEWLLQARDFPGALSAAQAAQALFPDHPAVVDGLGRAYLQTRDWTLAGSTFEKLRSLMPRAALPHLRLAELHQRQGNTAAVRRDLAQAFEFEPQSADVRRRLLAEARDAKGAEFVIDFARRLQGNPKQATLGLLIEGDVAVLRNRLDAALALYQRALGSVPSDATVAERVFDTLWSMNKAGEARKFAESWIKDRPRAQDFVAHVAQASMRRDDMAMAEAWFARLVRLAPDDGSAHNNLAMALTRRRAPEAVAHAERALALLPEQAAVLDTYARALASQGRLQDALAAQRRALAAAPGEPSYRLALAELLVQARDKAGAGAELDALAALGSAFPGHERVARLKQALRAP